MIFIISDGLRKLKHTLPILISIGILFFPPFAPASDKQKKKPLLNDIYIGTKIATAINLDQEIIDIDGKLDEISWEKAEVLTGFIQQSPEEGVPATERTEVRVIYDEDSFFVGVRAFDSEAEKIKGILARRDSRCPSDWIKIWIDSYHDSLTAFEFGVNPCGVKRDVYWSNDRRRDDDWDAIWHVEVTQDDQGWMAEFKIPFSQIRFPKRTSHTWGFQASRVIARKNETSYWRHVPKGVPQFVSLFGDINGINEIPSPKRLQLLPYSLAKSSFQPTEEGNPFRTGSDYLTSLGLDLKYGLSSNLTIDATFNPDFGQVEADPAQVNLTAYETYFPEKRPFFIEGKDILSFPLGGERDRESLFYSRRIGRPPQGDPSDAQFVNTPENTNILSALKLTGKTSQGWSIGIMEALTSQESASVVTLDGTRRSEKVEPFTNYFLGRAEREFRNGRSAVGAIFTAVNRKIDNANMNFLRNAAYSGGIGLRHRWANDTYEISGYFLGSQIQGSQEAILKAQESSARYFQRSDATHLHLDPFRTTLSGTASNFSLSKIGGEHWRWSIGGRTQSPGFEVNDMGYMKETDKISQWAWISYKEYKPGKIFRDYDINFFFWNSWDFSRTHTGLGAHLGTEFNFLNYWNVNLNMDRSQEHLSTRHLRGGPAVLIPGNWSFRGNFRTNYRKDLFFRLRGNLRISDNGTSSFSFSPSITIRPSDRLHLSLSPSYEDGFRSLQYVTEETTASGTSYILSRIDQTSVSLTLRLDYTITPTLSLQLYSQPFVSAGKYSEFKEVIEPRAQRYESRWHIFKGQEIHLQDNNYHLHSLSYPDDEISLSNPDFNFRQFRLNFVLRWEYLPGSTLFLVWTSGINDYVELGRLSLGNDLKDLFTSPANNAFLIKISYWFNI